MPIPRFVRLVPVALVLAAWLAAATPAAACSCLESNAADYVGQPGYAIFSGTALAAQGLDVPFVVDEWFQGSGASPQVLLTTGQERMPDGAISADTCGRTLTPGRWLVFATRVDDGRYDPGGCTPTVDLGDADGVAALTTVRSRLAGQPPPTTEPQLPSAEPPGAPSSGLLAYVAAPIALGALVFVVLVVVARRRGA